MLCDVMTIKHEDEDRLVCGTRGAERAAGLVLGVAGTVLLVVAWPFVAAVWVPLAVVPGMLVLPGLCVALSSRRFAFRRGSRTCVATIHTFGVIQRRHELSFAAVQMRRRFDWQLARRPYVLALIDHDESDCRPFVMGYAGNRNRAEKLAQTLAAFTQTEAIHHTGRRLEKGE